MSSTTLPLDETRADSPLAVIYDVDGVLRIAPPAQTAEQAADGAHPQSS